MQTTINGNVLTATVTSDTQSCSLQVTKGDPLNDLTLEMTGAVADDTYTVNTDCTSGVPKTKVTSSLHSNDVEVTVNAQSEIEIRIGGVLKTVVQADGDIDNK